MIKAFLLLFIILVPSLVFAQSFFINEIAWMGGMIGGVDPNQHWRYEWLELYNNADTVGMLDGWTLELYRDTLDFHIPLRGAISPRGYFLIGASDKIQGLDLNYKNLAGKFVNSGQRVVLKNSAGDIVDEVDTTNGWPAGDNKSKATMERLQGSLQGSDPCMQGSEPCIRWQTSANPGGTPKAQNSSGVEPKLMAQKRPVIRQSGESDDSPKKDASTAAFFIAFPGALLAGALALGAKRFLYPEQSRRVGRA